MDLLRFLLRLPFTLVKGVCWLLAKIFWLLGLVLRPLIGNIQWRSPAWVAGVKKGFLATERGVDNHPKSVATAVVLLIALAVGGFYGYHAWLNRPAAY
ncbi:hypothetical protein ACVWVX_003580 [Ewingella americana]